MLYQYIATDNKNKQVKGDVNADDKANALTQLKSQGLVPLSITAVERINPNDELPFWKKDLNAKPPEQQKIKKKIIFSFLNQMAIMLRAGVSLTLAMEILIDGEKNLRFQGILKEMKEDLYTGVSLSESMKRFKAFPMIISNMVSAGERNGRLDVSFERASILVEKELQLTSKVRSTMVYPCFLLGLTVAVVAIMNVFVLPTFANLFIGAGAEIPTITKVVMGVSDFISSYWYLLIAGVVAIVLFYRMLCKKNERFCTAKDQFLLRVPGIGPVLRKSYISRFCRILASMVDAGVDIVTSMDIASRVINNTYLKKAVAEASQEIRVGKPMSGALAKFPVFEPLLISMLRVGEESGAMGETLNKMADLYEEETDAATKALTAMMEPAITVVIGVVVGIVVISIVVPMFGMYNVIA